MADQIFNVKSGFYNAINNDRLYSADDMNKPYKRLVANGVFATNAGTTSTDLQVVSANDGMKIKCKKGEGIFKDKWFENPNDLTITVPTNATLLPRQDSVIVQIDLRQNGRIGSIVYRTGTPASSPQPPNIGTVDDVYEYRVANIYVAASAEQINNDVIVDLRGSSECPWVTSLIKQVDTSTLYNQYRAAYDAYYERETELFNEFMRQLTEQLTVNTNIIKYESHYVTSADGETQIPININAYNKASDVLIVRVNRLFASENIDYTISADSLKITLTNDLIAGQMIDFIVLQSVIIDADTQTILDAVQGLSASVSALNANVSNLISDSGWINFTLEGGASSYSASTTPAVRKYGNRTNIRGAIKGVTATNTVICTLPTAYKPTMDHVYTTTAVSSSNIVTATVTIQILASSGQVKILAKNGTIESSDMISIATNFIVG